MNCVELYGEMCAEGIFITESMRGKIRKEDMTTLLDRWRGVQMLASRRRNLNNRTGWIARNMWTDTALLVGQKRRLEREAERRRQRLAEEEEQAKILRQAEYERLAERKWLIWRNLPNKPEAVKEFLAGRDDFFVEYFTGQFLRPGSTLEEMTKKEVMMWLWDMLI